MSYTRVFQFRCCDVARNELVVAPMMAKRETIDLVGGTVIKHSAQDVESHLVDALGFYPTDILRKHSTRTEREHLAAPGLPEVAHSPATAPRAQPALGTRGARGLRHVRQCPPVPVDAEVLGGTP